MCVSINVANDTKVSHRGKLRSAISLFRKNLALSESTFEGCSKTTCLYLHCLFIWIDDDDWHFQGPLGPYSPTESDGNITKGWNLAQHMLNLEILWAALPHQCPAVIFFSTFCNNLICSCVLHF